MKPYLVFCMILICGGLRAQEPGSDRRGRLFLTWGYNRSLYHPSDITIQGLGSDFVMEDVTAHDAPSAFDPDIYLNPLKFTIPQFDVRVGYFIKDDLSVSLGWDHMKYAINIGQNVPIRGTVGEVFAPEYQGSYDGQREEIARDFIYLEHTDGLNFVRAAIEKYVDFGQSRNGDFYTQVLLGASLGAAMPWSDAYVDNQRYTNRLHLAGWGLSGQMALRFHYKQLFFLQYQIQVGFISMSDILFMDDLPVRAAQDIRFLEQTISVGMQLPWKLKKGARE